MRFNPSTVLWVSLLFSVGIPAPLQGQVFYTFTPYAGTYTPVSGGTTITPTVGWGVSPYADDGIYHSIPIGFNFLFDGQTYSTLSATTNGTMTLGYNVTTTDVTRAETYVNDLDNANAALQPLIAPLWDDMDMGAGSFSYITTGTAPNQVFTAEWANVEWLWATSTVAISFQVKLYESTNMIEFIYTPITPPVNPSASIGMTSDNSGSLTFLSLDGTGPMPNVSYSVETNNLSVSPAAGQVYRFSPVAKDLASSALISPDPAGGCYGNMVNVTMEITNSGSDPHDFAVHNVTVNAAISGAIVQNLSESITSGILGAGTSMNHTFSTQIDMSAGGMYDFDLSLVFPADENTPNDVLATQSIMVNKITLPDSVDFVGYNGNNIETVFPGWAEGNGIGQPINSFGTWLSATTAQQTAFGFNTARVGLFGTFRNEWIISPIFSPASTDALFFYAAVTEFGNPGPDGGGPNAMNGTDDQVRVMVSPDCGLNWTPLYTLDASTGLDENFIFFTVFLGAYAGQEIMVAFYATDGPVDDLPSYDFHIADIYIGDENALPVDLLEFRGTNIDHHNYLEWTTARESNSHTFRLERMNEEGKFVAIDEVSASGFSEDGTSYQIIDPTPYLGVNTYRLKSIDLDGRHHALGVELVLYNPEPEIQVFPNPFTDQVEWKLLGAEGNSHIRILDVTGRLIYEQTQTLLHGESIMIPTQDWPPGWYLYRLTSPAGVHQGKIQKEEP